MEPGENPLNKEENHQQTNSTQVQHQVWELNPSHSSRLVLTPQPILAPHLTAY